MSNIIKSLALSTMLLMAPIAHAQHFDWVKTYYGPRINGTDDYLFPGEIAITGFINWLSLENYKD